MSRKHENLLDKWGDQSLGLGFTAIPTTLLFLQKQLGITPLGMNILLNLIAHWWEKGEHPYPAQESIATRMGVSKRSIQREIASLIEAGLLEKNATSIRNPQYRGRNTYDLSPLIKVLNRHSPSLVTAMKQKKIHAGDPKKAN